MLKRKRMSELSFDIIPKILSRLPVKSMLRFKCVCKEWGSLISDPRFAKLHLTQIEQRGSNVNPHRLLLSTRPLQSIDYEAWNATEDGNKEILELEYPAEIENDPKRGVGFLGSCNGLVCLRVDYMEYIIWNPCTGETRQLPESNHFPNDLPIPEHFSNAWFGFGLGYDSSTDAYKFVKVSRRCRATRANVVVFSTKTNVWRKLPALKAADMEFDSEGIFLHGSLHWLRKDTSGENANTYEIISFDLAEDMFQEGVPLPDHLQRKRYFKRGIVSCEYRYGLVVSGDRLCVIVNCGENLYEGWQMKEFGVKSSWTRLFSSAVHTCPEYEFFENALCYTKTGKVIIRHDGRTFFLFDPIEGRFENLPIHNQLGWICSITYTESLVSPNVY